MRSTKPTESPKKSEAEKKESIEKESEFEDAIMVAYQKKEPGEWERVEIPYKKKKTR